MSNHESLGSFLRDSRKKKSISMRALARDAEISVAYLSKIEQDAANPTINVLERIATALGVPVSDLAMFIRNREQDVDVATASNTPESLKRFIEKYSKDFPQLLDPDYHRALSGIRFRGKYPENDSEWLNIFLSILNVLEK
ncbi:helix-turn-helix domain-containing protein [Leptolyngbyaceae cyanobacterium CCMR0082]|uniref:Helix-turn-helix domain-containing protein n=1 Tax=Adonisia turfae CCMR0082 TaxID=2304604 RepID=A0A6M0S3Y0_9CYAN|nr:helix-turn-helix domain-containing protein [Adonisia turfae]MDV3351656.1 helix-turn-helix domain-containing protein [Leptothoe sp. LEGE 181152]NEZ63075.1 helix-turn-helix domain-containing protein [Adonisia turfae CCMR0082]